MDTVSTQIAWRMTLIVLTSFAVCVLVVLTQRWHGRLSLDHDLHGAQKLHNSPVPRIGGLGLFIGLLVAVVSGYFTKGSSFPVTVMLLVCAMPVYLSGFLEDLTKRISVRARLIASFISAGLAIWLVNVRLTGLDTPIVDSLLTLPAISVAFTIFAVAGVTHSINIIDGLNGLAAGTVSIILSGLAAIAWLHGDTLVMKLCFWGVAAMVGFLILNYPFGRIFLGDGGAYLAGFWLAECAVLLVERNPSVSSWAVLLSCIYPIWETLFSVYRRRVVLRVGTGNPDLAHLHQLIYSAFNFKPLAGKQVSWLKHGLASATIWGITAVCQVVAISAGDKGLFLFSCAILFAMLYYWIYQYLNPHNAQQEHGSIHTAKI